MEYRQRLDRRIAADDNEPAIPPSSPSVCQHFPAARQRRDLFACLSQHTVPDGKLLRHLQPLSRHSAAIYSRLFPETPCPEEKCSLTLYERLTIALTVAQLTETGFLSDFYAAWLSPLPGPAGSRENNIRLTEITEYTRLLTCSSAETPSPGLAGLLQSGVTPPDILILHQLCGFVGWQAQWISGVMTLAADGGETRYRTSPVPPYPDLLCSCSTTTYLPRLDTSRLSTVRRSLLRDIRALGEPFLKAEIIGHAPRAARAWLILRALSAPPATAGHPPAENTAEDQELRRRTSPLSCRELERLKRQGWKTEDLLPLLGVIATNIWDYRLTQLAVA